MTESLDYYKESARLQAEDTESKLPESKTIISLSWEDIVQQLCQKGIKTDIKQLGELFDMCQDRIADLIMDDFWLAVDAVIDQYQEDKEQVTA